MNVALEPTSTAAPDRDIRQPGPEPVGGHSEWIDPEGDDWFSSIYRELTQESSAAGDQPAPEVEFWFG
jgi:hypothetical protein